MGRVDMLLLDRPDGESTSKDVAFEECALLIKKREQSRASTRRWRANQQLTLASLRQQVSHLEDELKQRMSGDPRTLGGRRMELVEAKKRFLVVQNMQLDRALKVRQESFARYQITLQRHTLDLLYDNDFLVYWTKQTQGRLLALDSVHHPDRVFNGIHCMTHMSKHAMHYDLRKHYGGLDPVAMGDLVWASLQDKAMYMQLGERSVDHTIIRIVNQDMVVMGVKLWMVTHPNQIVQRYIILHRRRSGSTYLVTATALTDTLNPGPHALVYAGATATDAMRSGFHSRIRGAFCLESGTIDQAKAAFEVIIFAQCRFETYVQASQGWGRGGPMSQ
ncbi:Aste57867_12187 [Aphanomyces stellatus]|uniref:Aste57867_12187 protein n=1 Tax=Aphanomyces stellatus TaxID=120398 RepID=A0A485KUV9_9STRA|nr:hypothetical protein As57867_012142 [Aphanomyces stellatus]VFT89041.1 Aste57867_12187 [Aphanomyces stellatus]